jgi:glutathione S-transferase
VASTGFDGGAVVGTVAAAGGDAGGVITGAGGGVGTGATGIASFGVFATGAACAVTMAGFFTAGAGDAACAFAWDCGGVGADTDWFAGEKAFGATGAVAAHPLAAISNVSRQNIRNTSWPFPPTGRVSPGECPITVVCYGESVTPHVGDPFMRYELHYWPEIQGRGEFIRLALEETGADYRDVARRGGGGMNILGDKTITHPPFAPPVLKAGKLVIAQTANILMYLGSRHGLAPKNEAGKLWANQLQLTIADFLVEIHDTHHPIASSLYYEDQRDEAKRRSGIFLKQRAPKFLNYFENAIEIGGGKFLAGSKLTYPDLSLFQIVAGLRYAFPRAMASLEKKLPRVTKLHGEVASRPRVAAYLASKRRIPFNQSGIFRRYPELDAS